MTVLIAIPAPAENSAEIVAPVLIVWARTDLPMQGTPTVNLVDLERYFVGQLAARRFQYVFPSATTKLSSPPGANEYLLELSVDALQSATRATRDEQGAFHDDPVLVVELSVTVKHPLSGQVLGKRIAPVEYHMSEDELRQLGPKRHALYSTADRLADFFSSGVNQGNLGQQMSLSQRPLSIWEHIEPWHIIVGIIGLVVVIFIVLAIASSTAPPTAASSDVSPAPATNAETPQPRKRKPDWDKQLKEALALTLATSGFSEVLCRTLAAAQVNTILANAAEIESREAERRLDLKARHAQYDKIAAYGAQFSFLDEKSIWGMLAEADEWPFLVLQEAKRMQEDESYEHQS
jgi:hypothetical protein